jgi:hypothetical protein
VLQRVGGEAPTAVLAATRAPGLEPLALEAAAAPAGPGGGSEVMLVAVVRELHGRASAGAIRFDATSYAPGDHWKVVVSCPPSTLSNTGVESQIIFWLAATPDGMVWMRSPASPVTTTGRLRTCRSAITRPRLKGCTCSSWCRDSRTVPGSRFRAIIGLSHRALTSRTIVVVEIAGS